ncbi:MAG: hypothetical protein ACEQSR_07250 [Candidatus Methylacidiphilales bacterium]
MKKIIFFIFIVLCISNLHAQLKESKWSIYGNAGYPILNNFDFKPTLGAFGDLGIKYNIVGGLSVMVDGNSTLFKKQVNFNYLVANYFTQVMGVGVNLLYEFEASPKWHIGIGGGYNYGIFSGRAFAPDLAEYFTQTGLTQFKFTENTSSIKGMVNFRRYLNKYFDAQLGVSYYASQSYYLDMFTPANDKRYDTYTVIYGGLLLKLNGLGGGGKKGSRKLACPNVNF